MTNSGKLEYWACYHDELGFLRFGSYAKAIVTAAPDPRGLFSRKVDAERRRKKHFWCYERNRAKYPGSEIKVVQVLLDWQADI